MQVYVPREIMQARFLSSTPLRGPPLHTRLDLHFWDDQCPLVAFSCEIGKSFFRSSLSSLKVVSFLFKKLRSNSVDYFWGFSWLLFWFFFILGVALASRGLNVTPNGRASSVPHIEEDLPMASWLASGAKWRVDGPAVCEPLRRPRTQQRGCLYCEGPLRT